MRCKAQIRNTKHEIRNKSKTTSTKEGASKKKRKGTSTCKNHALFAASSLPFLCCFVFRISCFGFRACRRPTADLRCRTRPRRPGCAGCCGPKPPGRGGVESVGRHRLQKLKVAPGAAFAWTNTSLADGEVVQEGKAAADEHGRVTLEKVTVTKGRNRIKLVPAGE